EYLEEYVSEKVTNWINDIAKLAEFALSQPQACHAAYTFGLKHQWAREYASSVKVTKPLVEQIVSQSHQLPEDFLTKMGNFTLLVFGTNGGMGLDCQNFLRTLANKLSTKNNEPYASVISWLRIQLSFAILRTVHRCVRGSRYHFR
ncbi:unnamed protein product, partial [Porites lobata]